MQWKCAELVPDWEKVQRQQFSLRLWQQLRHHVGGNEAKVSYRDRSSLLTKANPQEPSLSTLLRDQPHAKQLSTGTYGPGRDVLHIAVSYLVLRHQAQGQRPLGSKQVLCRHSGDLALGVDDYVN